MKINNTNNIFDETDLSSEYILEYKFATGIFTCPLGHFLVKNISYNTWTAWWSAWFDESCRERDVAGPETDALGTRTKVSNLKNARVTYVFEKDIVDLSQISMVKLHFADVKHPGMYRAAHVPR